MPATKIGRRRRTPARAIGSGFAGAALVAAVLATSPAAAATDDLTRVEPDTSVVEVDLWRAFRNCLSQYYAALDAMYPTSADVNECLEGRGLL